MMFFKGRSTRTNMLKITILCSILFIQVNGVAIEPFDLIDDAKAQVAELRSIVSGSITAESSSVSENVLDVYLYRNEATAQARVDFEQERDTLLAELQTIESLGESGGVDVTPCTDPEKTRIINLINTLNDDLVLCISYSNKEADTIHDDYIYYISSKMTYVEVFNFQIDYCEGDFLCISPILERVELAKVEIPQEISVEANKAAELCEDLKPLVKQCTDGKKSDMIARGAVYVSDAQTCADKLLS